jgi:hypothetical protein
MSYPNYKKYNQYVTCCKPIGALDRSDHRDYKVRKVIKEHREKKAHKEKKEKMVILEEQHLIIHLIFLLQ